MISINPFDVFFWTFRRNEKDVVKLYSALSPVMQIATGGNMLNFGFWTAQYDDPISAQNNMSMVFGDLAELSSATCAIDVGSGLGAPSKIWCDNFPNLDLNCVNINFSQLLFSDSKENTESVNATSTHLPFADSSVDRVLALESAQHFKPLRNFVLESKRILMKNGLLVIAMPVTGADSSLRKLGLLNFTWSSEHYTLDYLKNLIILSGFDICDEKLIGSSVYEPLANYYQQNRPVLKKSILKNYPKYVENILFKSIQKMKKSSEDKVIDYVLLKCRL